VPEGRVPATAVSVLRDAVQREPGAVFLDFGGERHSYGDVWTRATDLARGLRAAGVRRGDAVAAMLDNNADNLAAWYGANLLGAIWVGVNTALRGEFLRHVVADSGAKLIICEAEFVPRLAAIAGRLGAAPPTVLVRGETGAVAGDGLATEPLDRCRMAGPDGGWFDAAPDDVSMLIYTGGTTGPSKGCVIGHGYVINLCLRYIESTARKAGELNWSPLPMFHFNMLALTVTSSAWLGGTAAIAPRFSVSGFWPEIDRTGARIVNLLGSMGSLIARMPDTEAMKRCHGQIRVVHGAPFPGEIQRIWHERFGAEMVGGAMYGLTEAVPLTLLPPGVAGPAGTSGRRNDADFEVEIFDEADRELGPGQVGEIVARPRRPNVMFQGYWRRPEATVEATRNLWFHTGDLGTFDEEGFFTFVDRKKDYLRRRGENISSAELETAFLQHPDIELVAVHSVPSALSEDDVKVTAVLADGSVLTARELFEWSKERVPYFALPRYIEFRPALPTSATGRVLKYRLRDESRTPGTWDREEDTVTWERR
jgi:crotonobetaine/carnitine-CoA ligase